MSLRIASGLSILSVLLSGAALLVALNRDPSSTLSDPSRVDQLEGRIRELTAQLASLDEGRAGSLASTALEESAGSRLSTLMARIDQLEQDLQGARVEKSRDDALSAFRGTEAEQALEKLKAKELQGQMERWAAREEERCERVIEAMGERLGLNWAQSERVANALRAENQLRRDLMNELWGEANQPLTNEGYRTAQERWDFALEQMKEARSTRDDELQSLLSKEQFGEFQKLAKEPAAK